MSEQIEILYCEEGDNLFCQYDKSQILINQKYVLTADGSIFLWDNWVMIQDTEYDSNSDRGY